MTLSTKNAITRPAVFPVIPTPTESKTHTAAKARGFTQGHAVGYAAGLQLAGREAAAARARHDAEHAGRVSALEARHAAELASVRLAVAALAERTVPVLADSEQAMFSCALELAEALLGHELRDGETSARAALARAQGTGETEVPVAIRMNPADLAILGRDGGTLPENVTLVGDPALSRGDAVAEYPHGFLDARLCTAVDRVKVALTGGSMPAHAGPDAS